MKFEHYSVDDLIDYDLFFVHKNNPEWINVFFNKVCRIKVSAFGKTEIGVPKGEFYGINKDYKILAKPLTKEENPEYFL